MHTKTRRHLIRTLPFPQKEDEYATYLPWLFDQTVLHLHMIQVPYLQNPLEGPMSNDKANCKI